MNPKDRVRLYHAQYSAFVEDIPFWYALARESRDPILEMGCGTGRLVHALAYRGFRVVGLDHDAAMIEHAQAHLDPSLQEQVHWIKGELASFSWDGRIRLAIGALNTFAYLHDEDFCSAIKSVHAVLDDHGLIALDLPPFDADPRSPEEEDTTLDRFHDSALGSVIELRARVRTQDNIKVEVTWIYDESFPDGRVHRHEWEQTYFQRTEEHIRKLIQSCGLKILSIYGDYDHSHFQTSSNRMIVVIEK